MRVRSYGAGQRVGGERRPRGHERRGGQRGYDWCSVLHRRVDGVLLRLVCCRLSSIATVFAPRGAQAAWCRLQIGTHGGQEAQRDKSRHGCGAQRGAPSLGVPKRTPGSKCVRTGRSDVGRAPRQTCFVQLSYNERTRAVRREWRHPTIIRARDTNALPARPRGARNIVQHKHPQDKKDRSGGPRISIKRRRPAGGGRVAEPSE